MGKTRQGINQRRVKKSKYATIDGKAYLTKRFTVRKARAAAAIAAKEAMNIMGYVVIAKGNKIVRKYADGREIVLDRI